MKLSEGIRAVAAAALLAISACDRPDGSPAAASGAGGPATRVSLVRPARRDVVRRVTLPGSARADLEVTLYAKATGFLKTILKDRGDQVKTGELIASIEIPELVLELEHARASAVFDKATLDRLEAIRKVEKTAVTDQDLDGARAKHQMSQATVKRLEALLAYTEVRAPFEGTVTERFVDPGAFIQQGRIVSIVNTQVVRVVVDVPESEVRFARAGAEADVRFDALPGRTERAKISRTADSLDPLSRTMRVELDVPNRGGGILPGMYAHVDLGVERHPNALVVPAKAVVVHQDKGFVFVDAQGTAKKLPVTLGTEDGDFYEVLHGVTGVESIIVPEGKTIVEGMSVQSSEQAGGRPEMTGQVTPGSSVSK